MSRDGGRADASAAQFNARQLSEISGGDGEFEREIAREYLMQTAGLIDVMARALLAGDLEALRRAAHTLKGSSRTIGAEGIAVAAAELERTVDGALPTAVATDLAHVRMLLAATELWLDRKFGSDGFRSAA